MISGDLATVATVLDARLSGTSGTFRGVSTDTRNLQPGALYVALTGPRHDGRHFVAEALQKGAAGAVVAQPVAVDGPQLVVPGTRRALGQLARWWRDRFEGPVVGVTGSNGKTTVKEMLGAILRQGGATLVTAGNLNNDIGVPLTLCRLAAEHRRAVIEMGANHPGEIRTLAELARPDVGVVTNAGPSHLEGFGDVNGVIEAKGELFAALPEYGTAVINADDAGAPRWRVLAQGRRALTFGLADAADVRAEAVRPGTGGQDFTLRTPWGQADIRLPLAGRHNVLNALAAAAAALAVGAALDDVVAGLAGMTPVPGRLQVHRTAAGITVIDDTYNANPASLAAALAVLAETPEPRWAVLGDMGELGPAAAERHRQAGRQARTAGIDRLWVCGEYASHMAAGFGPTAVHHTKQTALIERLTAAVVEAAPRAVLVKGSRSAHMEAVVQALLAMNAAEPPRQ